MMVAWSHIAYKAGDRITGVVDINDVPHFHQPVFILGPATPEDWQKQYREMTGTQNEGLNQLDSCKPIYFFWISVD